MLKQKKSLGYEDGYLVVNGVVMADTPENREMARQTILDK